MLFSELLLIISFMKTIQLDDENGEKTNGDQIHKCYKEYNITIGAISRTPGHTRGEIMSLKAVNIPC